MIILFYNNYHTDCGAPVTKDHMHMAVNMTGTTFDQNVTYVCLTGYETDNTTTGRCNETGKWSIEPPMCTGKNNYFLTRFSTKTGLL